RALKASRGVEDMSLTERECDILSLLVQHAGETVTRAQLLQHAWGFDHPERIETRRVDVQMAKLRKKLGSPAGQAIETVHGSGYRYFYDEPKHTVEQSRAPSTRQHTRKKVMWFARWATPNSTGTGVIRDASPAGVFLSLDNPDDLQKCDSDSLWLQIYVPVGEPLELEGEIRWRGWNSTHNGHGFGLLFIEIHERLDALLHGRPEE
ncbi:MAG: winged helix-turn-helix domain-containing protein, partial [Myxococcota bacterium]